MPRIDMLLCLCDRAIERLEEAQTALRANQSEVALSLLVRAQMFVAGLASGVDVAQGEIARNCLRLYEFAADCIRIGTPDKIEAAIGVLRTLREGFEGIRGEAVDLERKGAIPPLGSTRLVEATG
jgi:flagellin-specific chaperone FliS